MLPHLSRHLRLSNTGVRPLRLASRRCFTLLGLESSADDTCAAVVTSEGRILSNVVVKQNQELAIYGGIHPYAAIQRHQQNMPGAIRQALDDAGLDMSSIDGIAYTRGPGIGGCLSVCSTAAKTLGATLNKPIFGVHHMQAHALTPLIPTLYAAHRTFTSAADAEQPQTPPQFPFLALLISGGHTLLLLARSPDEFTTLATTPDISIGNAFDHVARYLGLAPGERGYGAALEAFAAGAPASFTHGVDADVHDADEPDADAAVPDFAVPLRGQLAFSYGGPRSRVEIFVRERGGVERVPEATRRALARAFQAAAVRQLEEKTVLALRHCEGLGVRVQDVVVSGGVASNSYLRQRLRAGLNEAFPGTALNLVYPPPHLCTDNAVMVAWAGMHRFAAGDFDTYDASIRPKWRIDEYTGKALARLHWLKLQRGLLAGLSTPTNAMGSSS
ncbi:peptidase M22, glycoprotease [Phanerochaete sordida]|uniref:N(6)-L-threonylcarbamoyladenine synthase n=1 Tax=Phanerochaete sordida TaxID=48140 RepID=A0A9P3GJQ1_9APHY|nr:peptidase M22, glycoprotease [Phanerochaete sordida]